eukprot:3891597-Ditylum_brightwellii.AAC.1
MATRTGEDTFEEEEGIQVISAEEDTLIFGEFHPEAEPDFAPVDPIPVQEFEEEDEGYPNPPMTTPAERFLGADRLSIACTVGQIHAIKVIVKKTDHASSLDAKELKKLQDSAEEDLTEQFDIFRIKPGTQELENVYNIALLMQDLSRKVQLYDMEDIFGILIFDGAGVPTAVEPID